jgi:FtsP/CotA-like multicopper oxidase with cupredoxin domain
MGCILYLFVFAGVAAPLVASDHINDNVECGPLDTACECDPEATVCSFQFYVEYINTFARYNFSRPYATGQGELYYIDDGGSFVQARARGRCMDGDFVKRPDNDMYCNDETGVCIDKSQLCTEPVTVDSKTFKMIIAVNKQFPGPTLIVREGQIVAVDVYNNLTTEGISIHWHGQHLMKTNFMDGVGLVTQCPISAGSSFRYIFKAGPSGTFWYHSHMGSQRSNGLFGALIVKEKDLTYPISFIDDPASHTLTVMDWYQDDYEAYFRRLRADLGVFPNLPPFTVPTGLGGHFHLTLSPDFTNIGVNPFWSALVHGKGRHPTVSYKRSSLNIYEVDGGQMYRFRLIHTGNMYSFRFSIDNHKLTVMATDGYLVEPVEVDYIALHVGERYDFLVEANQGGGDYWMKAETFEINNIDITTPPFDFIDHKAEAILHYSGSDKPTPLQYGNIPSLPKQCTEESPCKILNCPFGEFHPSYNITCIGIDSLRLVTPTPESEMPDETPDVIYFMNIAGFVQREKPVSSINENHFVIPQYPLTTHYEKNDERSFCDMDSVCKRDGGCFCTVVMDVDDNATVRLVFSALGEERNSTHSPHIHGHSVHVLKVGYGEYSSVNGSLIAASQDLTCTRQDPDDNMRCPHPRFRSSDVKFSLDRSTVRKDTFILPAGGYVVVQFRANNPGFWFINGDVELYYRQGFSLVIREAVDKIKKPPKEMETCDPAFLWDIHDFMSALEEERGYGSVLRPRSTSFYISSTLLAIILLFSS